MLKNKKQSLAKKAVYVDVYVDVNENVDEDVIRNSNIKMGIVITEKGLKYQPYSIDQIPYGRLSDYIIASCSAWPFFKKTKIDGKVCYDGYYSDNLPVDIPGFPRP